MQTEIAKSESLNKSLQRDLLRHQGAATDTITALQQELSAAALEVSKLTSDKLLFVERVTVLDEALSEKELQLQQRELEMRHKDEELRQKDSLLVSAAHTHTHSHISAPAPASASNTSSSSASSSNTQGASQLVSRHLPEQTGSDSGLTTATAAAATATAGMAKENISNYQFDRPNNRESFQFQQGNIIDRIKALSAMVDRVTDR